MGVRARAIEDTYAMGWEREHKVKYKYERENDDSMGGSESIRLGRSVRENARWWCTGGSESVHENTYAVSRSENERMREREYERGKKRTRIQESKMVLYG